MALLSSKKFLSDTEHQALQDSLNKHTCRDSLMLELLNTYGMRTGELLAIRVRDLNLQTRLILIKGTKGSRDREFPLSDRLFDRLHSIVQDRLNSDDRIFPISRQRLFYIWRHWRPCNKPLHSLRHSVAVRMYAQTKDIALVQQILGHKQLTTTLIYQQFSYQQDVFKEVFLGADGV
jgi:integrase/recombinase XerD